MMCIFDIETVPDIELLARDFLESDAKSSQLCEMAMAKQKEKSGSDFLPVAYHRIVSIASVITDEYGHFIKVGNFGKKDEIGICGDINAIEKNLIEDFLKFFNRSQPKLVSFNGRGFDLPTIMLRAMRYNLCATAYYEQDNPTFNKSKWENYRQRFSERFHTDLLDSLGHFGLIRSLRLDSVCSMLGIPGKYDMNGSDVYKIYYDETINFDEKMAKIDEYCQSDVLNTYWVYLKYELLKGELALEDYYSILNEFCEKIPQNAGYTDIFIKFIKKELAQV